MDLIKPILNYEQNLKGMNNSLDFVPKTLVIKKYSFWKLLSSYWHLIIEEQSWILLFTLFRLVLNTFGPFLIYRYFCDFNFFTSFFAALITGLVSAAFQFYNEKYINWLNRNPYKLLQCLKWYSVEILFLSLPYVFVFIPLNIKLNSASWILEFKTILITAIFALISQGIWDLALAYQKNLNSKFNYFDPSKAKVVFNFRFLMVSFLSVLFSMIKITSPALGKVLFILFMISGVIYYLYLWLDKRLTEIATTTLQ